jgi:membrane associated rhomboid family serine protease
MSLANDIRTPFKSGNVLMQLIIINIAVFAILNIIRLGLFFAGYSEPLLGYEFDKVLAQFAMPMNIHPFLDKPWTLFTYFFSQVEIGHIFWNMLILYFFGSIIQEFIGYSRTLAIYVYGGVLGALLTILLHSTVPSLIIHSSVLIGASGSVMAIVVAAATLVPEKRVFLFIIGEVKLVYIALFYVVLDFIGLTYIDHIGHICHLGGALSGFLFIRTLRSGTDLSRPFNKVFYGIKRAITFKRKPARMKVVKNVYTTSTGRNTAASESKIQIQRRIDSILDKISKGGYESLTKEEKDYLFTHGKDI